MKNLDELLQAFQDAALELFQYVALANPHGLPFIIEVQDAHGQSLLSAQIQREGDRVVYVDEDHVRLQ